MVNILIAEDDRDDLALLQEAIENVLPKFRIHHARDGKEFTDLINQGLIPHLVFLDLNMPKKNGIQCLIEFRQKKKLQSTPVIIYSTSSYFDDIDQSYKHGCTLYLVKPESYTDLVTQIRKVFFRIGLPKKELLDKEMFVVKKHER